MVKSVLAVKHQGLRDWMVQRVSAVVMAVYVIVLAGYLFFNSSNSYGEWHYLFAQQWMKVATMLFLLCLMLHAWVGMWTIFTDYVKPYILRCILHALVLLSLVAYFFWGLMILWSV